MTRASLPAPSARRIHLQCLLLHLGARWLICGAFLLALLSPLVGSNLLASSQGDEALLARGASSLVTLLLTRADGLSAQGRTLLLLLLLALATKVLVASVTFDAIVQLRSLGSRDNLREARRLFAPFAALLVATMTLPAVCGWVVASLLATLGALLLPLLGEQRTDLVQLGLALTLVCGWLALVVMCEVTRVCLATQHKPLRAAICHAWATLGRQCPRFLIAAVPRYVASLGLSAFGLFASMRTQYALQGPFAPLAAWLVTEVFAVLSTWLYLSWIAQATRLVEAVAPPKPHASKSYQAPVHRS